MNTKFISKITILLFLLSLPGVSAWTQEDEFNLGDEPAATQPSQSAPAQGADELSLPDDFAPSSPAQNAPQQEPTLDIEQNQEPTLEAQPTPSPKNELQAEPTPAPTEQQKPTEIAIPKELPPNNMQPVKISDSDPDFKKEERFHKIYKKYNERPTNIEQWEKIIGNRSSESYQIQKDDTLWDLSKTLFGDSNYWPKIWSLNKESVYNPHQINPKLSLTFYPGTKTQPPTLGVSDKPAPEVKVKEPETHSDTAVPVKTVTKSEIDQAMKVPDEPDMGVPKSRSRIPVLKRLPPSLPEYSVVGIEKPKLMVDLKPKLSPNSIVSLPYYITDQSINEVGEVKETEIGISSAFEYQYVFVTIQDPSKKIYTVIRENNSISLGLLSSAKHIEVQGEIELVNKIDDESNLYRALVRKSLQRVEVGSKLLDGPMPKVDISSAFEKPGTVSKIIGGQYGVTNEIYSSSTFVFLDGGANQGYKVNDVLPIYASYQVRNAKSSARINERKIGLVKIVKVSDAVSTGFILKTFEDVQKGDVVGSAPSTPLEVSTNKAQEEVLDVETPKEELSNQAPEPVPQMENIDEGTGEDELTL